MDGLRRSRGAAFLCVGLGVTPGIGKDHADYIGAGWAS